MTGMHDAVLDEWLALAREQVAAQRRMLRELEDRVREDARQIRSSVPDRAEERVG